MALTLTTLCLLVFQTHQQAQSQKQAGPNLLLGVDPKPIHKVHCPGEQLGVFDCFLLDDIVQVSNALTDREPWLPPVMAVNISALDNKITSPVRKQVKDATKEIVEGDIVSIVKRFTVTREINCASNAVPVMNVFSYLQGDESVGSIVAHVANQLTLPLTKSLQKLVKEQHIMTQKNLRKQ